MKKLFLIILLVFVVSGCIRGSLVTENKEYKNDFYVKDIKEVYFFSDGGTTGFLSEKSNGEELKFCFDGRMHVGPGNPPRHIFINATHPEYDGAQELGLGSPEEEAILESLNNWLLKNYSKDELIRLSKINTVVGLTEDEIKPYRVLNLIGLPNF